MGSDKALIEIDGTPMLALAIAALRDAGATEIVVVGRAETLAEDAGVRCLPDRWPGEGPLGGLIQGLSVVEDPACALLPCDGVAPHGPAISSVVGALGTADVVVPVVDGSAEFLHTAWRTAVRTKLADAFTAGARSIRTILDELDVVHLLDSDPCWAPDAGAFRDADTPAELPERGSGG